MSDFPAPSLFQLHWRNYTPVYLQQSNFILYKFTPIQVLRFMPHAFVSDPKLKEINSVTGSGYFNLRFDTYRVLSKDWELTRNNKLLFFKFIDSHLIIVFPHTIVGCNGCIIMYDDIPNVDERNRIINAFTP